MKDKTKRGLVWRASALLGWAEQDQARTARRGTDILKNKERSINMPAEGKFYIAANRFEAAAKAETQPDRMSKMCFGFAALADGMAEIAKTLKYPPIKMLTREELRDEKT